MPGIVKFASFVVAAGLCCLVPTSAAAQEASNEQQQEEAAVRRNLGGNGLLYEEGQARDATSTARTSSGGRSGGSVSSGAPRYAAYFPALVAVPGARHCIEPQRRWFADELSAQMFDSSQEFRWMLLYRNGYDLCPEAERPPRNPAVEASEYWRVFGEDLLPKPQPRIQPGYMLTGKLAYLEANDQPTARFEHPTPIGTLVIDATATLWVDWGDGRGLKGPFEGPDGPWPNGKVTGFWTNAGTYDVQVVQRWSATWQLGGRRGDLRDLSTEGVIEDFEVRDLQAVRNR